MDSLPRRPKIKFVYGYVHASCSAVVVGQTHLGSQRYPSLDQTATFSGHTHRVLYLAMSPDGRTIVTGAGDETLRFWAALPERKDVKRETLEHVVGRIR